MTLSPSLSVPNPSPFPPTLLSPQTTFRHLFFTFSKPKPHWRFHFQARANSKELIPVNPSVTVEKGKYSYDVETLINRLITLAPRGSIARCLDPFKNKLSLNDFALVFKEFAQRGDWQRSLRLFKYMQRQIWCKPNEHIYTIMITLLGREGLLDKCREVFDEMPSNGVVRTVFAYTAIINAYGRNGQFQASLELLDRMKRERVSPSILTYNTVINACARGGLDWEGLLGLFAEMRHEGVQPDVITYNTLLSACAHRGLGDEAEMVFRTMNEGGVVPDINTYSYVVQTFRRLNKLEKVSELLREMESGGNLPDISSYNVLLEAYAELGSIREAIGVFRQMQAAGCVPNAATYSILLNLYGKHGRYDDVRDLFLEMKVSNTDPDAGTYNILIQVFGEGGYFKEVVTLFHDMVEENIEPNMETYEGLIFACGKGGLYEDAKKILSHMNEKGIVPSSKAYTGVIEAFGQAALYEEALVAFNTMNEVGSNPTVETYSSLVHACARGGLYKEVEAILFRLNESGLQRDVHLFNGVIEAFRQGGQHEEAVKAYVEMEKANCEPNELTLEAVLSIYCSAGLVEESEEQFQEIKASGILPSVMCYCMMLALYAKNDRSNDAYNLIDEMIRMRVSDIHQVIGQMIKGDFDDESNWQIVEYVFDKLNSEGCGLGMRFYNALLEALWWMFQRERAARVLKEASKRGLFPELFRSSKLVWSVDVHRMSEGGALTALSIWLNNMQEMFMSGEDLPELATVVVVRGFMEKSTDSQDFPIAKAAISFLQDNVSSSFAFPGWNKGRIVCQQSQLRRILSGTESSSSSKNLHNLISLSNTPLTIPGAITSKVQSGKANDLDSRTDSTRTELLTSAV
ncbi:pentatricopeptide repeat-containing protein At1g74850, chloroplastic isoform X1 [Abrus precatorius]|uniref:Pentatricopeptide repeat-containing protein At1g74850, chloroplastic isoform X1 n=1 Tax=Abrus precatorius TaxID=3816 RepID=A0A8B8JDG1_ABRPR|nr:pentatricopeptide repeat-containing protein At1g74850, chloroplastic isoform X1 [Abrus precatorius]